MALQALGYVGFGSADLDDWRQFGTGLVGLQAVERSPSLLAFRMDDRKQRIVIDRAMPDGARFFGWEVADAAALDALAAQLEKRPRSVIAEPQTLADNRRVARPDFVSRSRRQSPRGILRRRNRRHAVQPGPFDLRFSTGPLKLGDRPDAEKDTSRANRRVSDSKLKLPQNLKFMSKFFVFLNPKLLFIEF